MAEYQGSIKAITDSDGKAIYPVTMTSAIFNEDGTPFNPSSSGETNTGISSNISRMKLLFIGDSMSAPLKWQTAMTKRYGIDLDNSKNYSGNGWSILSVNEQIYRHQHPLDATKDGVIIMLGTNDAHYIYNGEIGSGITAEGYTEGNYDDSTDLYKTSFHASVKLLLKTVLENYAGKPILWVGSPRRNSATDIPPTTTNAKLQKFTDYIAQHCKDYGIKFLDLYNEYNCFTVLSDGIHPNDNTYIKLGRLIGNVFNNMC